jgi:uncharacterized membrane protein
LQLSQPPAAPAISRSRIEGLSDLIFGLALSIGAIELVLSSSTGTLTNGQIDLAVAGFGFNFLILINVWSRYTTITSALPIQKSLITRLNMALLFLVAIEPYFFNILITQNISANSLGQNISAYYAVDVGVINLILGYFTYELSLEEKNLIPKELVRKYKVTRNVAISEGVLFLISALPIFWYVSIAGLELRIVLWILSFPVISISRLFDHVPRRTRDVDEKY